MMEMIVLMVRGDYLTRMNQSPFFSERVNKLRKGSVTSEETAIYTQSRLESDIKRTGQN